MKNSICIYVIYDIQGVINPYISEVLRELKRFIGDIYVVCNFQKIQGGEHYIRPYAKEILYRDNIGFDAGAYKYAICDYIGEKRLSNYDELVLTNDTYFAPLYRFDEMFAAMRDASCDFWGITRHPGGYNIDLGDFEEHIQSYFLCLKKKIIRSKAFWDFWDRFECAQNKAEAVMRFELGINRCLLRKKYIGLAYTDIIRPPLESVKGINPYMAYAYELVSKYRVPIIKKTNFYGKNPCLINAIHALDYIETNCTYDIRLIKDYINEYQRKGVIGPYFDFGGMESFVRDHDRIFIYGEGVWGHNVADYMNYRDWNYDGFLVTDTKKSDGILFSETEIKDTDGIIIAQEYKDVCDSIREYIKDRVREDQIFTPEYP